MKKLLLNVSTFVVVILSTTTAGAFSTCKSLIQNEIDFMNAKIKGLSIGKYLAVGAGAVGGIAIGAKQSHNRYIDGFNAGATSY